MLELAIFGSLALLALAFMIQIGLQVNYQQEIDQQTFRRALNVAASKGTIEPISVSVIHIRDRQVPDPTDPFAIMARMPTQATSLVQWGTFLGFTDDEDRRSQPLTVVRINEAEREFRDEDLGGDENAPFISSIVSRFTASGSVTQRNGSSSLSSDQTAVTTVGIRGGNSVSGSSSTSTGFNF